MNTIVIVDDRADDRAALIAMLAHRKYRLIEASSGAEALAIIHKEKPDLVITGVLMPKMDGYEFVQQLRQDPKIGQTKVVFYTASSIEEESRTLAKACGVEHIIIKPAEPETVFKIVDAALGAEVRTAPVAASEFAREHLNLVRNKWVEKFEELQKLTMKLEHEITERKNAQETLERLRRHHELILSSAGEGIHGLDLDGNIIFENQKAAELLGWSPDELQGKPAHATMHHTRADGGSYPVEACPIYATIRDGATRRVTSDVFWRKDGTGFRVDYVAAPIKDDLGRISGSIVTFKDITEQFAAEGRQKLQTEQYRLLFETNPSPMWVFDTERLQILAVNEAAIEQYGYAREEFLKLTLRDLRPADDLPDLMKAVTSPQSPAHFSGQFRHVKKDGSLMLLEIYSAPVVWGGVDARIVTAIDRTERARVEEELRSAHKHLQHLLAHTPAVLYVLKIEGENVVPIVVSENVERLLGVTVEESMRYEWWLDSLHPEDRDRATGIMAEALKGDGYSMEYRLRHKDGSYHWVEDKNRVVRDAAGEPQQMVGVWTDITERKRTEERLREQADIIQRAQDAVIVRDFTTDVVTVWNSGAERLYGWSASEAIGRPMGKLIFAESNDREMLLEQLVAAGEFHGEVKHRAKDGHEVIVDSRATLIRNDDDTPRSVLGINTNITEQKKLEKQLLRTQRLESIGTLASGVAHDLNNILVPILMAAPILRYDLAQEEREKFLTIIESSAQRGANVVNQVLTFARGAAGDRILLQPIYLLEEIAKIAQETFPKTIRVRTSYPEDLRLVEGDPTQLHQVLLNLCVNARDAMPDGGTLSLTAENFDVDEQYATMTPGVKSGPHVLISVIDTGTGIPQHIIDKIFDPFFTTKELGKGTGLGLSTALGIVKSHGGVLNVYSAANGTTFRVLLPSAAGVSQADKPKAQVELPTGHGETILIVDDESAIREVAKAVLSKSGYKVLAADDGPAALALFMQRSKKIDVVLTDLVMPIMSGLVLARTLRKMDAKAKIIVSSARDSDYSPNELKEIGVQQSLTKPYTRETLLRTIGSVLQNNS
jgi:PAS domain S-box-containing protein